MILYCDTSALIKRYVEEEGTEKVDALWSDACAIATSVVAFAETFSAFRRKLREGLLSDEEYVGLEKKFREDYKQLILVPIKSELDAVIEDLIRRHPLKGFDAIHLASALVFKELQVSAPIFACFDNTLNKAAMKEGIMAAIEA